MKMSENHPGRWTKLQKSLDNLISPKLYKRFAIHCTKYNWTNSSGYKSISTYPRCWLTLDKQIIWEFPGKFIADDVNNPLYIKDSNGNTYWNETKTVDGGYEYVMSTLKAYVNTPYEDLNKLNDIIGLVSLLQLADKRTGKRKLTQIDTSTVSEAECKLINARLN